MLILSKSKIREIAQELEGGLRCFYHTETGEVHGYPDFDLNPIDDNEFWQEIWDELEANFDKYIEFKNLPSRNHFEVMMDFAEQVPDKKIQENLIRALNRSKPFRNFKDEIDYSGDYRQQWFRFKEQAYANWVQTQIDEFNRENQG